MNKTFLFIVALACAMLGTLRAEAHAIGLSSGEYRAFGVQVDATLTFARGDVMALVPSLDADHDGALTEAEVNSAKDEIARVILAGVSITSVANVASSTACAKEMTGAALTDKDGLAVSARFSCDGATERNVNVALLADLPFGHRHLARVIGATSTDEVLYRSHDSFTVKPAIEQADASRNAVKTSSESSSEKTSPSALSGASGFFRMGLEHILTGYDHLVFLFGLVLVRGKLRSLLAVVTAFTFAHSLTLGIAVMGWFTPSAKIIEPAIALSIAYVGIENFFVKSAEGRWRITMPFGLIHGFGFASALRELELPVAKVPVALVSFNLGVEAGQLMVMAVLLPLVYVVREKTAFSGRGLKVLSTAVALAGGIWFVARIVA